MRLNIRNLLLTILPRSVRDRIEADIAFEKVIENVGWLLVDRILRMAVGVLVAIWLARYLGPQDFGLLNLALALAALIFPLATLGLEGLLVRELIRDPLNRGEILGTTACMQAVSGIAIYVFLALGVCFAWPQSARRQEIFLVVGILLLTKAADISVYYFEALVKSKITVWVQNSFFLIFSLIRLVCISAGASLMVFAWLVSLEAVLSCCVLFSILIWSAELRGRLSFRTRRAVELLRQSWPLILSAASVVIYMKIDQLMLGHMIGDRSVGIYSAATRISEVWYFGPLAIVSSIFPSIIESKVLDGRSYQQKLQRLYDLMVRIAIPVAVVMAFMAEPIINILYGHGYSMAGPVLTVHVWGSIFVFIGVVGERALVAEGRQVLSMLRTALGAVINVVLNFLLIPGYQEVGAAVSTLVSYAIAGFGADLLWPETRSMFFMKLRAFDLTRAWRPRNL